MICHTNPNRYLTFYQEKKCVFFCIGIGSVFYGFCLKEFHIFQNNNVINNIWIESKSQITKRIKIVCIGNWRRGNVSLFHFVSFLSKIQSFYHLSFFNCWNFFKFKLKKKFNHASMIVWLINHDLFYCLSTYPSIHPFINGEDRLKKKTLKNRFFFILLHIHDDKTFILFNSSCFFFLWF